MGTDGASAHSTAPPGAATAVPTPSPPSVSVTQPVQQAPPRGLQQAPSSRGLPVRALGGTSSDAQRPADMESEHGNSDPQILSDDPAGIEYRPARTAPTLTEVVSHNSQRRLRQQQSHLVGQPSYQQHGSSPNRTTPQHHSQTDNRLPRQPRLPSLPLEDYKEVIRPRTGLILAQWLVQCVTNAIGAAAQISDATQDRITFRIRRDQNVVVVSTPDLDIAKRIRQITTLNMESKKYEVTAYIAVADNSSKGIITAIAPNTTTDELVEHLRSPNAETIHARMMGKYTTAFTPSRASVCLITSTSTGDNIVAAYINLATKYAGYALSSAIELTSVRVRTRIGAALVGR
ncbi:hypothetical protein HPB48_015267 [Haemaphysalis longicornis]|uniref:Uncharacterized protein n=1 Tax=Haemaphysalis longicornis TaxID=44386 RepID=A0A9J6FHR5_HAELO|nr:hypothetical protein HPB48_015267 [Haemaphysalis longicornis]